MSQIQCDNDLNKLLDEYSRLTQQIVEQRERCKQFTSKGAYDSFINYMLLLKICALSSDSFYNREGQHSQALKRDPVERLKTFEFGLTPAGHVGSTPAQKIAFEKKINSHFQGTNKDRFMPVLIATIGYQMCLMNAEDYTKALRFLNAKITSEK